MAQLRAPWLRAIARFGSGVGVVVDGDDLVVYLAKVRPTGARLAGTLRLEGFRQRPAMEWGAEYQQFLKKSGFGGQTALVALPRQEVIARRLQLPGLRDEDAAAAIAFQLDGLHPFGEDDVVSGFERLGTTDQFVVAIVERRVVEEYAGLFAEAGVELAGFTYAGGAVRVALRRFAEPAAEGLVAVSGLAAGGDGPWEVYGESPTMALFSAEFETGLERAVERAVAELRLAPETEARDLMAVLPAWESAPDGFDFSDAGKSRAAGPWAVALAGACGHLGEAVNVLPVERRTVRSRAVFIPTAVLAVVLVGLLVAWGVRAQVMERQYAKQLEAEAERLAPAYQRVRKLDRRIAEASERVQLLDEYRKRTKANLDVVLELTELIPAPGSLGSLQIDAKTVQMAGEMEQADGLLKRLDASRLFQASEFTAPLARTGNGEVFRVKTQREGAGR